MKKMIAVERPYSTMPCMARIFLWVVLVLSCVWMAVPEENVLLRPLLYPTPFFQTQLAQQGARARRTKDPEATTALAQSLLALHEEAHALRVLSTLSRQATARVHFLVAVAYAELDEKEAAKQHIEQGLDLCKKNTACTVDDRVRLKLLSNRLFSAGEPESSLPTLEAPARKKTE